MGCTAVGCGLAKELQVTTNEDKPTYRPVLRYIISGAKNIRIGWVKPAGSFKNIFYIVSLVVCSIILFICYLLYYLFVCNSHCTNMFSVYHRNDFVCKCKCNVFSSRIIIYRSPIYLAHVSF